VDMQNVGDGQGEFIDLTGEYNKDSNPTSNSIIIYYQYFLYIIQISKIKW